MPEANGVHPLPPRCAVLVGPQSGGKTTLLESLLFATGAIPRKGSIREGSTTGDASEEARARQMSTETSVARTTHLGESWSFLDCPGSVELGQEVVNALMVADIAIVVCEADLDRAVALSPLLRLLDEMAVPHMLFINKMDTCSVSIADLMTALQGVSSRPLVLRQVPVRDGDAITGYVDLVSERVYRYKPGAESDLVQLPDGMASRKDSARQELLEALADFDDGLLEQLLEDVQPAKEEVYQQIAKDVADDLIVPVLLGAADRDHGVRRLLKALRHDAPAPQRSAARLSVPETDLAVQVFKTVHAPHSGKQSFARIWHGALTDGMMIGDRKLGGLYAMTGGQTTKLARAEAGEVVVLGRLDHVATGDLITTEGIARNPLWPEAQVPVFSLAIKAQNRNDEVKLSAALQRLAEEDASLRYEHSADTGELLLHGQGEVHLQIVLDRLQRRFNVAATGSRPAIPYRETIRKGLAQHARFKRQSGGHGQFADIHVDIKPLERGAGITFTDSIVGGVVPKQYIPSVEMGVRDYLTQGGPLGFPVVDVSVTLTSGQFHAVDSSDMAFRTAGRMAMAEALPKCDPVLLEPIWLVTINVPSDYTAKAQRILSSRRGQILGFSAREGWDGWDEVKAYLPQSELHDLIVEIRSLTLGVGNYTAGFDHLAELTGRLADKVTEARLAEIEGARRG